MKTGLKGTLLALAVAALLFGSVSSAVAASPTQFADKEFSLENGNPNGVWTYGWMPWDFSVFVPFTTSKLNDLNWALWYQEGMSADDTPGIGKNQGRTTRLGVAPGQLTLHPGPCGEAAVLRFTAPTAGQYDIDAKFFPGDIGAVRVGVRKGSAWLWMGSDSGKYSVRKMSLRAGERIDFVVDSGYDYGNTPLECKIKLISTFVAPASYDLRLDYSTAGGNPNGTWAYGWMPSDLSEFVPFTSTAVNAENWDIWLTPSMSWDWTPHIAVNNSNGTQCGIGPGMIALHPGPHEEAAVARFTAPEEGLYTLRGQFLAGDLGVMQVGLRRGSTWLWRGTDSGRFGVDPQLLAEGESVDLLVYGGYVCGNTGVECTVTRAGRRTSARAFSPTVGARSGRR